jgi:hypothetical protein
MNTQAQMGYKLDLKVTGREGGSQIFYLRIRTSSCQHRDTSGFHEMRRMSKLADKSLTSLKKGSVPWN